jgi:hypothetical protein
MRNAFLLSRLDPQLQTLSLVQPVHSYVIDSLIFPLQKTLNLTIAKPQSCQIKITNTYPQRSLIFGAATVTNYRKINSKDMTILSLVNNEADAQISDWTAPVKVSHW